LVDTANNWHQIDLGNGTNAWVASWLTDQPTTSKQSEPAASNNNSSDSGVNNTSHTTVSSDVPGISLEGYNIMLDAGHGGIDPGSIGLNGEEEQALTLQFTQAVADKLQSEGANVLLTRSADEYVSLDERMRINDAYMMDAFISLHFDASLLNSANGMSTHYYENGP